MTRITHEHLHRHLLEIQKDQEAQSALLNHMQREQDAHWLLLRRSFKKIGKLMTTAAELSAKADAALAALEANTNAIDGVEDFLSTVAIELKDVKKQLQDLIDAGNSPPELTEVGAKFDVLIGAIDAQAVKLAAVKNTPEDPND